jgi:hypothetical protein
VIGIFVLAFLVLVLMVAILARFSRNPTEVRGEHAARERMMKGEMGPSARMDPRELHDLVVELLERAQLPLVEDADDPAAAHQRLVARQPGPFRDRRHIVVLEAAPPGDIVESTTPLELAEEVKADWGAVGVLVTPYAIDQEGLGGVEGIELVDGPRLSQLVERYLPERSAELNRYRLGGPGLDRPLPANSRLAPT